MRRLNRILPIILALMLMMCSCATKPADNSQEPESIRDRLVREIDGEYEKELSNPENFDTASMIKVSMKYAEKWDEIAEEYYNKILALHISNEQVSEENITNALAEVKASWGKYYQANTNMYEQYLAYKFYGGTIVGPLRASNDYDLKMEYALKLVEYYEMFTWDSDVESDAGNI